MGFMEIIESGSTEKLQELIDAEGLPINYEWIDYNLLNLALAKSQKESAMMLIERGCRVNNNVFAPAADTPLHHAVKLGSIEIVELLLRKGASIHARNSDGETALHLSAKLRNDIFTDLLLASLNDTTDVNYMDSSGLTYLHIACIRGNLTVIEKLLVNNCEINHCISIDSPELPGYTALHCAIKFDNINVIKLLLNNKVDVSVKAKNGFTPLHLAVKCGALKYVKMLLRHTSNINLDINAQIDRDSKEYSGYSALHFAVDLHKLPIFKLLLQYKPNTNLKDASGLTPLHMAIKNNSIELVINLLDYGVDVNCAELVNHQTPLHIATLNEQNDIISILLKHGANVNSQEKNGLTPLLIAASYRYNKKSKNSLFFNVPFLFLHNDLINESQETFERRTFESRKCKDILDLLLSATDLFEANPVDKYGLSHFHIICMCCGKDEVLAFLQKDIGIKEQINARVEKNSPIWPGYTALHFAVENGKLDVVKILLEYNANVKAVNTKGLTPIHLTKQLTDRTKGELILDELLKTLYKEVANCNDSRKNQGLTILHVTCMQKNGLIDYENLENMKNVEAAIDMNSPIWPGCTPLHLATIFQRHKVVENLIFCSAKLNVEDARGLTPLHIACMQNDENTACVLLANEVDVNYATRKKFEYTGKTPLHIALNQKQPSLVIVNELLMQGANINAKDSNGDTPISLFANKACKNYDLINSLSTLEVCLELLYHTITLRAIKFKFIKVTKYALKLLGKWVKEIVNRRNLVPTKGADTTDHFNQCLAEINKLKSIKIDNYCSLYDILLKDIDEMAIRVKNTFFQKIVDSLRIEENFPIYGFLIKVQYNLGCKRKVYIENAKEVFEDASKISLPDSCTENIFKYLSNTDLGNLIEAIQNH